MIYLLVFALGMKIGMDRFCINSSIINEMAVFYPKTHDKRVLKDGTIESNDA
jgi:hypothetical protein